MTVEATRNGAESAPHVELRRVTKRYGVVTAINDLNLAVEKGSFTALLGPSGCGKSTLLRMIAGLETITAGQCIINGVDVTEMPPAKRRIAMVFQSYALYPHMTVRQNIAFSLSVAGRRGKRRTSARSKSRAFSNSSPISIADRLNFPADNVSGSRSVAPWCVSPRVSYSTNRCRISTRSCACRCASNSQSSPLRWA